MIKGNKFKCKCSFMNNFYRFLKFVRLMNKDVCGIIIYNSKIYEVICVL